MPQGVIRVVVCDDHEAIRAGVAAVLAREPDLEVVAAVATAEEAISAARWADVAILDYRLPDSDGAAACAQIRRRRPETAVVVLSALATPEAARVCVAAGARGFVAKDADSAELAEVVRAVARGQAVLGAAVACCVGQWAHAAGAAPGALEPAEVVLLEQLAQGCSNREIGARLRVSEHTVKVRLRRLMRKLGVARRAEAVAAALRDGVI